MTLTREQNERLTHVGPGTPMGELMRRYWHPVAVAKELSRSSPRSSSESWARTWCSSRTRVATRA